MTKKKKKKQDDALNIKEAAALLGVSVSTIYRLYGNGHLKARKITGMRRLRFRRSDVLRLHTTE